MSQSLVNPFAISPAYAPAMTSRRLSRLLLPDGPGNPYHTLDCDATLVLHDPRGSRATFQRKQAIRFTQNGVSALLDRAWGDGVILTNYRHSAGLMEDTFKDGGVRHLIVGLKRPASKGQELRFVVERETMESFGDSKGTLQTGFDHPIGHFSQTIIFPKERPVQLAVLRQPMGDIVLRAIQLPDGRTAIKVRLSSPELGSKYAVDWSW